MKSWLYELLIHWSVNLAIVLFPRFAYETSLEEWEFHWQRRRRVTKARWHIQKSSPRRDEPGVDPASIPRREEALLALWRSLHTPQE